MRLITQHQDLINVLPKLINPLFCLNFGNILDPGRPGLSLLCWFVNNCFLSIQSKIQSCQRTVNRFFTKNNNRSEYLRPGKTTAGLKINPVFRSSLIKEEDGLTRQMTNVTTNVSTWSHKMAEQLTSWANKTDLPLPWVSTSVWFNHNIIFSSNRRKYTYLAYDFDFRVDVGVVKGDT